eukprot:TRINITY_DN7509_c0_g1_i1.p1 TRINITY_DN7509_c0_g1~~TRINITY_DN7509_c0_g1_i1.p1  ORF type:complete len:270 (+),score=35.92 TRINITY_DN7509_c0_g1_i1:101-811(+)
MADSGGKTFVLEPEDDPGGGSLSDDWPETASSNGVAFTLPNASRAQESAVVAMPHHTEQAQPTETVNQDDSVEALFENLYGDGISLYFIGRGATRWELRMLDGTVGQWPHGSIPSVKARPGDIFEARDGENVVKTITIIPSNARYPITPLSVNFKNAYMDGVSLYFVGQQEHLLHNGMSNQWPYGSIKDQSTYPGHIFEARMYDRVLASWTMMADSGGKTFVLEPEDDPGGGKCEL